MSPRYVIADGLGICFWLYGEYFTADIDEVRHYPSEEAAKRRAERAGLEGYTIQPVTADQIKTTQ